MAKKEQKIEEPIALDVQLNKSGAFIEKNWKKILYILHRILLTLFTESPVWTATAAS